MKQPKKKTIKKIKYTHFPFFPRIRVNSEGPADELMEEITKVAKRYKKPLQMFSAKFELLPNPIKKYGHFLVSEVTYEGDLTY